MTDLAGYLPLVILACFSVAFAAGSIFLSRRLSPPRPTPEKLETYECGERSAHSPNRPIELKYYLYVLLFLILEVAIIFLIPWAVELRHLGPSAQIGMAAFIGLLLLGWAYAWKEGLLEWLR